MEPWTGAARPSTIADMNRAAARLGCDLAAIRAIWEVEASGREFVGNALPMRFEPHHMPGSRMTWRQSLAMSPAARKAAFDAAFAKNPEAALRATSFGAPQIMGFNHAAAGFPTAESMVKAMAESGAAQIDAFVNLVTKWGLDRHIRAHDWYKFAVGYNGSGQPDSYAKKIEAAYRKHSGGIGSPVVLRFGAQGEAVKVLQTKLGLEIDGIFGRDTEAAVKSYQRSAGLVADGIVGFKTWKALDEVSPLNARMHILAPISGNLPPTQPVPADDIADALGKWSGAVTGAAAAAAAVKSLFPYHVWEVVSYGLAAGVFVFVGTHAYRFIRAAR